MWKELDSKSSTCQSHSERIFFPSLIMVLLPLPAYPIQTV